MNKKWILFPLLVLALFCGFFIYNKFRVAPAIDLGSLRLSDTSGNSVKIASYKGHGLIMCFSASWCGNCWQELGALQKIRETELRDVEIVVISDEPIERLLLFGRKLSGRFTYLKLENSFASLGINAIPTTYILNKQLEVKKEKVGYIDWEDLSTLEHLKTLMD